MLNNTLRSDSSWLSEFIKKGGGVEFSLIQGQTLYYEELRPLGIFFIVEGKVKLIKEYPCGREKMISIVKSNYAVGVREFISGDLYKYTAITLEDSKLIFLDGSNFKSLLTIADFKTFFLQFTSHN